MTVQIRQMNLRTSIIKPSMPIYLIVELTCNFRCPLSWIRLGLFADYPREFCLLPHASIVTYMIELVVVSQIFGDNVYRPAAFHRGRISISKQSACGSRVIGQKFCFHITSDDLCLLQFYFAKWRLYTRKNHRQDGASDINIKITT